MNTVYPTATFNFGRYCVEIRRNEAFPDAESALGSMIYADEKLVRIPAIKDYKTELQKYVLRHSAAEYTLADDDIIKIERMKDEVLSWLIEGNGIDPPPERMKEGLFAAEDYDYDVTDGSILELEKAISSESEMVDFVNTDDSIGDYISYGVMD